MAKKRVTGFFWGHSVLTKSVENDPFYQKWHALSSCSWKTKNLWSELNLDWYNLGISSLSVVEDRDSGVVAGDLNVFMWNGAPKMKVGTVHSAPHFNDWGDKSPNFPNFTQMGWFN